MAETKSAGAGGARSSAPVDPAKGLLSRVVRYARQRRGLTQAEVAARLGVRQASVSGMEDGHALEEAVVERFAAAIGATFEEIVQEYLDAKRAGLEERAIPAEVYEPPGPSRERQLRRLYAATGGDAAAVARVVGKAPQGVREQLRRYGVTKETRR